MEFGAEYTFSSPEQFSSELADVISVSPTATLEELDFALRSYVDFASTYMDEFLSDPTELDQALFALLDSPLFRSHGDRMTLNIIGLIEPTATSAKLVVALLLVLHLGSSNPLSMHSHRTFSAGGTKVFRLMRKRWSDVVPVLMKWVWDAAIVQDTPMPGYAGTEEEERKTYEHTVMPADGWEERVGTAATAVLYEVCRVQKLSPEELSIFSFGFISHLFLLVERTRDAEDETFNYSVIKLIIALNEQFMVSTPPSSAQVEGGANLPPPILPTIVHKREKPRGHNLVLEVLREKEGESKTFCENIIFILNRGNNTPDSLCVSLLILKILYLLFTTAGTQEYFYTNDLCVLVDVFIRELNDLGEESEGLKHTYLRVLHPLLTNTQLRTYSYKRPQLRKVLKSLAADSLYRRCDPTTKRLVERNLRGSWCEGLPSDEDDSRKNSASSLFPTSPVDQLRNRIAEGAASSLSIDAVAQADDETLDKPRRRRSHRHRHHRRSQEESSAPVASDARTSDRDRHGSGSTGNPSPMSGSAVLEPVLEGTALQPANTAGPVPPDVLSDSPPMTPSSLSSSFELPAPRRRRPPPPPSSDGVPSRPLTPSSVPNAIDRHSPVSFQPPRSSAPGHRRPAPEPPTARKLDLSSRMHGLRVDTAH